MNQNDLPHDIDAEKALLAALLVRQGEVIPVVGNVVEAEDFYRPEHKSLYRIILQLYEQGIVPNVLSILEHLRNTGEFDKVGCKYVVSIAAMSVTNDFAKAHADIIKEKAELRRLIQVAEMIADDARQGILSSADIVSAHRDSLNSIGQPTKPSKKISFGQFFSEKFKTKVAETKSYANRVTGFDNLDAQQFFMPGLYVIGATPAAGKTTFCYQLLEQLADKGERCIYCSYEMSQLELFSKSLARELFKLDDKTTLTAAQIRKGGTSAELERLVVEFADSQRDLSVLELQDETIDDLLNLLRPLCTDKARAPVVCLDYLQIVPTNRESAKLGIDEAVCKLKKFQRDTNTTFIVISSFNRTNYAQEVSFESFKESGNIEYTADVVWALQLDVMNRIKGGNLVSESRRQIDEAKKRQPRQIHLKCLKNRQGTNYDCFFEYHSAHDYFDHCAPFGEIDLPSQANQKDCET